MQVLYFLCKGVLCCKGRKERVPKIVVPSKLVPIVFSYYHNSPVRGHKGISRTIAAIRKHGTRYRGQGQDVSYLWPKQACPEYKVGVHVIGCGAQTDGEVVYRLFVPACLC